MLPEDKKRRTPFLSRIGDNITGVLVNSAAAGLTTYAVNRVTGAGVPQAMLDVVDGPEGPDVRLPEGVRHFRFGDAMADDL